MKKAVRPAKNGTVGMYECVSKYVFESKKTKKNIRIGLIIPSMYFNKTLLHLWRITHIVDL